MQRVPGGRSTSTRRSPLKMVRGALLRSRVTTSGWDMTFSVHGLVEREHRPAVGAGETFELAVRVHGSGVADDAEHGHVRVAVGVREAVVEIVTALARVIADEARLLGTGDDRAEKAARGEAVLDLEAVRDD